VAGLRRVGGGSGRAAAVCGAAVMCCGWLSGASLCVASSACDSLLSGSFSAAAKSPSFALRTFDARGMESRLKRRGRPSAAVHELLFVMLELRPRAPRSPPGRSRACGATRRGTQTTACVRRLRVQ